MDFVKEFFERFTDLGSLPAMGIYGLFFLVTNTTIFFRLFLGIGLSFIIISCIRYFFYTHRPNEHVKPKDFFGIITKSSFPSLHAAYATVFAILVGLSTTTNLFIFFSALAIFIMYSRLFLEKHYFIDIVGGIILGALLSFGVLSII
jgi:membrane-associated phospholipid phosphatase